MIDIKRLEELREIYRAAVNESVALHAQVAKQQEEITKLREDLTDMLSMAGECVPFGDSHCTNSFGTPRRPCVACDTRAILAALAGGAP